MDVTQLLPKVKIHGQYMAIFTPPPIKTLLSNCLGEKFHSLTLGHSKQDNNAWFYFPLL